MQAAGHAAEVPGWLFRPMKYNRPEGRGASITAGAIVTIKAMRSSGAGPNGFVVDATCTTMTSTDVAMAGGVNAMVGLKFGAFD
ncbi:hypothetical protein [Massilia glaciei]|uniref:hypothetical protein n=1 Tax=Massilia glaciei TaxID=1524097 RepID=UPI0015E80520|nr:hypothetical protein [Massilia glaciei]